MDKERTKRFFFIKWYALGLVIFILLILKYTNNGNFLFYAHLSPNQKKERFENLVGEKATINLALDRFAFHRGPGYFMKASFDNSVDPATIKDYVVSSWENKGYEMIEIEDGPVRHLESRANWQWGYPFWWGPNSENNLDQFFCGSAWFGIDPKERVIWIRR